MKKMNGKKKFLFYNSFTEITQLNDNYKTRTRVMKNKN